MVLPTRTPPDPALLVREIDRSYAERLEAEAARYAALDRHSVWRRAAACLLIALAVVVGGVVGFRYETGYALGAGAERGVAGMGERDAAAVRGDGGRGPVLRFWSGVRSKRKRGRRLALPDSGHAELLRDMAAAWLLQQPLVSACPWPASARLLPVEECPVLGQGASGKRGRRSGKGLMSRKPRENERFHLSSRFYHPS